MGAPFPTDPHYETKAWDLCLAMLKPGQVLFWNAPQLPRGRCLMVALICVRTVRQSRASGHVGGVVLSSPGGYAEIMQHASHPDIIARLKRAQGHLTSVLKMLEEGRPCSDIAQQMHAVENAIGNAKRELIHDHIEHCLDDSGESDHGHDSIKDLKLIAKFL